MRGMLAAVAFAAGTLNAVLDDGKPGRAPTWGLAQ